MLIFALFGCSKSAEQLAAEKAAEEQRLLLEKQEPLKELVRLQLRDPESAQFKSLTLTQGKGGTALCGLVNAKNGFGGYMGFVEFVAATNPLPESKARVVFVKKGLEKYLSSVDMIAAGCGEWQLYGHVYTQCWESGVAVPKLCSTGHTEYVRD